MRKLLTILIFALLVSSCGPSQEQIQATVQVAMTQTQAAQKIPLSEINLDSVLFQSGDLPSQYTSGQIAYKWADGVPQAFPPDNVIIQKVGWDLTQGFTDDYLLIALYESKDNLEKTYQDIADIGKNFKSEDAQVGDKAFFMFLSTFSGRGFFTFTRCNAIVIMDITGADVDKTLLQDFAQRVDKRLKPLVCAN